MPEPTRELIITRAELLALKDEQQLVKDGYNLLDEKRILLAQEIRKQVARLQGLRQESATIEETARAALQAALRLHGIDELSVYPPLPATDDRLQVTSQRLVGLTLQEARLHDVPVDAAQAVNPTPEAHACALAFRGWRKVLIEMAACSLNLKRLVQEYIRTQRRAEALENVLLPEIEAAIKMIDEQLESQDQEEAARLRQHMRR